MLNKYAILIENKYYTPLHLATDTDGEQRNQLEVYQKKFNNFYIKEQSYDISQLRYVLITCIEREDEKFSIYNEAKKYGFEIYSFYDLLKDNDLTESDIFNEFWIRW